MRIVIEIDGVVAATAEHAASEAVPAAVRVGDVDAGDVDAGASVAVSAAGADASDTDQLDLGDVDAGRAIDVSDDNDPGNQESN